MNLVKIIQNLDHPNIVKFYEILENDETYYLVYEYFLIFKKQKNLGEKN